MAADAQKLTLVHVVTVPETLGFLSGQIGFLREHGFDVHAIASPGESLARFGAAEGIAVHPVAMSRRITPQADVASLVRLRSVLRRIRPHVVHAHTPKGGLLGTIAARLCRVPVRIYHLHGLPLLASAGPRRALLRLTERIACSVASRVLSVSGSIREAAISEKLCADGKIAVVGSGSINGVDSMGRFDPGKVGPGERARAGARLDLPPNARVLAFVGRIVRDKGVVEVAEAWAALRGEVPDLHLVMAGIEEAQDPVPPEVMARLRSDPRVRLAGWVDGIETVYAIADVLALPSYREGFGLAALEAAAMEVPAVASRIPGCVDAVVDGVTGALVPPRDPEALAGAIRRYLRDAELRTRHGRAARERALREFIPAEIWRATYEEYLRLLRAAGVETR